MSIPAGSQPRIYMTGSKKTSHPDPTADLLHGSVDITRQGGSPYSFHRPSLLPATVQKAMTGLQNLCPPKLK